MTDLQDLGRVGAVAPGLLERPPDELLLHDARGLLDAHLTGQQRQADTITALADLLRQALRLDDGALGEHHGVLDGVLQLSDVPRPGVLQQQLERLR